MARRDRDQRGSFTLPQFGNWVLNSIVVSGFAALTVTIRSALVAFGFAYFKSSSITGEGHFELLMAAAVITTVPMLVLFFLGQRYFVEGIATTGSKG